MHAWPEKRPSGKCGRLKSRRRERSSRGRTPPTRIGATSCGMHRTPMPFGRERWHRPPRFAHADSLRMGVGSSEAVRCIRSSSILPRRPSPAGSESVKHPRVACFHRGGLRERLVRAAPPDLTSLARRPMLWTCAAQSSLSRTLSSACGRWPGKKVAPSACSVVDATVLPRCEVPRPPSPLVAP